MATKQDCIPANICDELRRLLAVKAYACCHEQGSIQVKQQKDYMRDLFHGNEEKGIISLKHELCNTDGQFSDLYENDGSGLQ